MYDMIHPRFNVADRRFQTGYGLVNGIIGDQERHSGNYNPCLRDAKLEHLKDGEDVRAIFMEELLWVGDVVSFMFGKMDVVRELAG